MDFTVTDIYGQEKGYLEHCGVEFTIGTDNNFEMKIQSQLFDAEKHGKNCRFFCPDTEYGGLIRSPRSVTEDNIVKLTGPSWRGILGQRALKPESNTYAYFNGEANTLLASYLSALNMTELFSASSEDSGIMFTDYQVPLQSMFLGAFEGALAEQGARLEIKYKQGEANDKGYVLLGAVPITDHSNDIEISEDGSLKMDILDYKNGVNHLICLGKGELEDRQRIDLYAWPDGSIKKTQYYTGIDLIEDYYENASSDTSDDLEEDGREKFEDLKDYKQLRVSVSDMDLELGDIVGGRDRITGIYMSAPVVRKIVTVTGKGRATIDYKLKGED